MQLVGVGHAISPTSGLRAFEDESVAWRGRSITRHLWVINVVRPSDDLRRESVTNVVGSQNSVFEDTSWAYLLLEECPNTGNVPIAEEAQLKGRISQPEYLGLRRQSRCPRTRYVRIIAKGVHREHDPPRDSPRVCLPNRSRP